VPAAGFYFPLETHSKESVWPDSYDPETGEMVEHPFAGVKPAVSAVNDISGQKTILTDDPGVAYWYTEINRNTRCEDCQVVFLAGYGGYERQTFSNNEPDMRPSYTILKSQGIRYHLHTGVPAIHTAGQLERVESVGKTNLVIFTDYRGRAGNLRNIVTKEYNHLAGGTHWDLYADFNPTSNVSSSSMSDIESTHTASLRTMDTRKIPNDHRLREIR
jgi:hypothetical protein